MFTHYIPGVEFHGEFSSADASGLSEANSRFTLYGRASKAAITLGATSVVVITDVQVNSVAAVTVQGYDGADATVDAGEEFFKALMPVSSTLLVTVRTPHYCQPGTYPKVKTSGAGQVDVLVRGSIWTP